MTTYGPSEVVAYCQYHMSSRFVILRRVFEEMRMLRPSLEPLRVLDFGCGPGTAASALVDVWGEKIKKYEGIDISNSMLDAARIMTRGIGPDCTFWGNTKGVIKRLERTNERFNLAICAYTLSELTSDAARFEANSNYSYISIWD